MAGLAETVEFPEEVYQIETTDPVVGGAPNEGTGAGMSNIPHLQLAKRTRWLKAQVDTLVAAVVDATTAVKGIVQLSTSTNSTSTTTAATPSAVKAANDNANTRALKTTTVTGAGLATGGGDLSANRTITVPIATQAEAEAGTADDKAMTPLSTAQAVSVLGSVKAWVNFNGTGTVAIRAAFNVTSIMDNGVGNYTVNFLNPLPDQNYALSGSCGLSPNSGYLRINETVAPTQISCNIHTMNNEGSAAIDNARISAIFVR